MPNHTDISFVVPVCDEEATLAELCERISNVVARHSLGTFEIIFIDDGSSDDSWAIMQALKRANPETVTTLGFRRNLGKAAALAAGFEHARGEIIFTIDADLQDDPDEIPAFLKKLDEGYDCVSGWKKLRKDPLGKTLPSRVFNGVTAAVSGVKLHDFNCGFKAYRADAAKSVDLYGELHRYIPVLLAAKGFKSAEIPVKHHRRTYGVSKYGWKRLFKGGIDLMTVIVLTRYLKRPGHFFGGLGLVSGFFGFTILSWLSIQKLVLGVGIGNRPMFFLGILLLLLGVQLITTGLLGELIQYNGRKAKPSSPPKLLL